MTGVPSQQSRCGGIFEKTTAITREGNAIWKNKKGRYLYWVPDQNGRWLCGRDTYRGGSNAFFSQATPNAFPINGGSFWYSNSWQSSQNAALQRSQCHGISDFLYVLQAYIQ